MALTLDQIRTFVREHLDLEEDDLSDNLLDTWSRDGSHRIERAEPRWPFYQQFYVPSVAPNAFNLYAKGTLGADLDQISHMQIQSTAVPAIKWVGYDALQDLIAAGPQAVGRPRYWAEWADFVSFYPQLDVAYSIVIRGFRQAADWVAEGAGGTPDMPEELHNTVLAWVLSKAYAQQEDPELASLYERQFSDELNEYRRRLTITPHPQPLVMGGGALRRGENMLARPKWAWELD